MPEFSLEDLRRIYMIQSLFPKKSWEYKKVCYDDSADAYGSMHRSVTSLKSYWNIHHHLWDEANIMHDPPLSIPNALFEAQKQQDEKNDLGAQDPESLLEIQDQQRQHNASISEQSGSYVGQDQVQHRVTAAEYPLSYVNQGLLRGQDQQGQQNQQIASMTRPPASYTYSQYPMHPTNPGPSFAGTTHEDPHFPNSSSGWVISPGGSVSVPAGQQPLDVASYFSAGSPSNTFVACNPHFTFTPQTTRFQATEPCFLQQVPEENLANHDVNVERNVTDVGSSEGDSDTTFDEES